MDSNKKIKVLFRHRSMEMGGVEKVMLSLMNHLDKEKYDMTLCLSLFQGELRNEVPKHVRLVYLTKGKEDFSKNKFIQKIQLLKRKTALEKFRKNPEIIDEKYLKDKYDVEIAMTYNDFELVLNSTNPLSKKIGWFHSEINVPKLQPLVPNILKHFPKFDYMIYCSEKIKERMHCSYPELKYPKEQVIINAIQIEEIKKKAEENISDFPKSPVFISIGRLHTRKGFHKLMEAHKKLIAEGFKHTILILGDGEEKENLLRQQKHLGVENTFILGGNKMNPYPYIKNADFFIMPSESEAWPLVIAESLILKKPIIATKVGDVEMMIEHKKTGYLINYDTEEMYAAMKEFLTNPSLVKEIKENLRDSEKQFDNQKIFDAVDKILTNIN